MNLTGPQVLVVDDDWMGRELLEAYLKQAGYQVRLAHSGEQGLRLALAEPPAVIMLDVLLPGIDGIEVCRQLKQAEHTRGVAVLMITALLSEEDRQRALAAGADGFVTKPFRVADVLRQVAALAAPAGGESARGVAPEDRSGDG